jgi:hypothetical protein
MTQKNKLKAGIHLEQAIKLGGDGPISKAAKEWFEKLKKQK